MSEVYSPLLSMLQVGQLLLPPDIFVSASRMVGIPGSPYQSLST